MPKVILKKSWVNEFGKRYAVGTVLELILSKALELIYDGVAEYYDGVYPPKSKLKMNLKQLNNK